jgi:hypothetical protein
MPMQKSEDGYFRTQIEFGEHKAKIFLSQSIAVLNFCEVQEPHPQPPPRKQGEGFRCTSCD